MATQVRVTLELIADDRNRDTTSRTVTLNRNTDDPSFYYGLIGHLTGRAALMFVQDRDDRLDQLLQGFINGVGIEAVCELIEGGQGLDNEEMELGSTQIPRPEPQKVKKKSKAQKIRRPEKPN